MSIKPILIATLLASLSVSGQTINYQQSGEDLLDKIVARFYNSSQGLYAEKLDSNEAIVQEFGGISFVWPASHALRGLRWGYKVNPTKYRDAYHSYVYNVYKYKSSYQNRAGYAVLPGSSDLFFDDNAVMSVEMALADSEFHAAEVRADAQMAYDFCNQQRDENWGLPQVPAQLGQGMFYSMAMSPIAYCASLLHCLGGQEAYRTEAIGYYTQLNDPAHLLKDTASSLFNQYTFCTDGAWSSTKTIDGTAMDGRGLRAYQTTYVIRLALALYRITADSQYLADATTMMNACVNSYYKPGQGLREISFWGGDDMIDALEEMYETTADLSWHAIAKDIVDFLITYGRDQHGWYPGDYDDSKGDWNVDRRTVTPSSVLCMGQTAAASAIFNVAFHELHPVQTRRISPAAAQPFRVWTTCTHNALRVNMAGYQGPLDIALLGLDGRLLARMQGDTQFAIPLKKPLAQGLAVVQIIAGKHRVTKTVIMR
jgi:hypothetical protein